MMIKAIAVFTAGILTSGLLFTLQTFIYRGQAELTNLKLEARITELEQLLEDAVLERPTFTSVPTQADRDALRFPTRPEREVSNRTLSSEKQLTITASGQVTLDFINLLEKASIENDLLNQKLFNDVRTTMELVQQKALSGNFVGFFEILNNAQVEVDASRGYAATANLAIANLATYTRNSDMVADAIKSEVFTLEAKTLNYSELVTSLLDLLDQTLTGNVPNQDLLDEIDVATLQVNEQSRLVIDQYLILVNSIAS
jgi:hypothetical protein